MKLQNSLSNVEQSAQTSSGQTTKIKHSLIALAVSQAIIASSAQAATIWVNDFSDVDGADCTLRQAISSANTDAIVGGCTAGSGDDTIRFDTPTSQTIGLTQGSLDISSNLDIIGPFHTPIVIDGSQNDPFIHNINITAGTVTLDHLTIQASQRSGVNSESSTDLSVINSRVTSNEYNGISSNGALTVTRSTIDNNNTHGIYVSQALSTINHSTISGNLSRGINLYEGVSTINNSTITKNGSVLSGAGIYAEETILNINHSIVAGNVAGDAAEIFNRDASITSQGSLFGSSATTDAQAFEDFTPSGTDINANAGEQNIPLANILDPILANNGGPNLTHNLVVNSVAINKLTDTATCNTPDQRGEGRSAGVCDIGAVEYLPIGQTISVEIGLGDSGGTATCTLNQAIKTVNTNRPEGTCDVGGVNDIITFDDTIDTITLFTGLPLVRSDVTIQGGGVTVNANGVGRVLDIAYGVKAELDEITLTGGTGQIYGAGLNVNFDTDVTLTNSTISGNSATSQRGGGLAVSNRSTLRVIDSTVSNNHADQDGGGVAANTYSRLEVNRSTFSANTAAGDGGGINVSNSARASIENSTLDSNSARYGGGLRVVSSVLANINNSTISGNVASANGGGVVVYRSELDVVNLSIVNNEAPIGGILSAYSKVNLQNSIVSNSNFELSSNTEVEITSLGNNLIGNNSKTTNSALYYVTTLQTDILATSDGDMPTPAASIVSPLSNNGGPTRTHALPSGSPALDMANSAACPATDQRGESRGNQCDIGAFDDTPDEASFFVVPLPNGKSVIFSL